MGVLAVIATTAGTVHAAAAPDSLRATAAAPGFPGSKVRAWQTGLLRYDRLQHESLSLTLGLSFGLMTRRPAAALTGGLSFGVLKEVWDMRRTRFDGVDLTADLVGTAAAYAITAAIED